MSVEKHLHRVLLELQVGRYRFEVGCSSGTGKVKIAGGVEGSMKASLQRAFAYLQSQKVKMGIGQQFDMPDVIREDMAFLDRIHFYIPGWEIPKMRVEFFTDHNGFVVDYLAEALRELRSVRRYRRARRSRVLIPTR